jgi:hypothetical protein
MLRLTGSTLTAYDYPNTRFITLDRNTTDPNAFSVIANVGTEYPMFSAATSNYLYYAFGNSEGNSVFQVNRASGQKVRVNDISDWIFGLVAFGDSVYWTYRNSAGQTGVRRVSDAAPSVVHEAVKVAPPEQSVGSVMVDASGIYHSFYDGTNNFYYRTPHGNPNVREIVSNGYQFPYQSTNAALTSNSIVWLSSCHRYGGGWLYRLAKP